MTFSKAIQIKHLVNRWNKDRAECGFGRVVFNCDMFQIGCWSVNIDAVGSTLFFSHEMNELITLYAGGGFTIRVFAFSDRPSIDMQ